MNLCLPNEYYLIIAVHCFSLFQGGVVAMSIQSHLDYFRFRKVSRKCSTEDAYKHCLVPNVLPQTINCMQPCQARYHTAAFSKTDIRYLEASGLNPVTPPPDRAPVRTTTSYPNSLIDLSYGKFYLSIPRIHVSNLGIRLRKIVGVAILTNNQ